jgi:hypothetical protein
VLIPADRHQRSAHLAQPVPGPGPIERREWSCHPAFRVANCDDHLPPILILINDYADSRLLVF